MATVYKAKCHVLNRFVAVKILRDEFTTDEEFIKRFEIEAQSAASITHPNIVSVYDVGVEGNLHYIVMELIQGKTLKEIIVEERGPLPWKWSVNIAIQIASALEVAHKNNIVHRDVKPHNIIITEDGIAKVTDFGIAKAVSNSTITAFGTTMGSVHYFSPEHARGGFTDAKSDLYSLGVVLYEMLTGKVPFDADTPVSVALKHLQENAVEPIKINSKIPQAINNIIMKALKKETALRYQKATEMLRDLKYALKNPNGEFVDIIDNTDKFSTQKISTIYNVESRSMNKDSKKDNKFIQFIKKHNKLAIFISLILLFVISLAVTLTYLNLSNPKEVELPNLVGMASSEAETLLNELEVLYEVSSEEFNSEYAEGYIISQEPAFDENYKKHIKQKSTVKVTISKGIEEVTVPKVIGMEKDEAIDALEKINLKVEVKEETSKKVEEGIIVTQDKKEGETLNAGDTIIITVSTGTGIKQVSVPSLIGKKEEEATNDLKAINLVVKVAYDEDKTKDNGVVLKQSKTAGETVDEKTEITITVNKLTESKDGTVIVNVKSLMNGKYEYEDEEETTIKKVNLKITVESDTVFKEAVDPTSTDISQAIKGKGNVTIKVYIDDVLKNSGTINLNNETTYTAE